MSAIQYHGVGKRKSAIARVYMRPGEGKIIVNGRPYEEYLCRESLAILVRQPLERVDALKEYDIRVNVKGGGLTGQAGAIRLGIARALVVANAEYRPTLREAGFLTRDARRVERKKYGQPGARKRFQFSKR
jgi:small subunit ribosomal protein S9